MINPIPSIEITYQEQRENNSDFHGLYVKAFSTASLQAENVEPFS